MTNFTRAGGMFRAATHTDVITELPAETFVVSKDINGYYLEMVTPMTVVSKLYGDVETKVDRVMRTYEDRSAGTGVLLSGEKGSGKTLFAKKLSQEMRDRGHPTIVVTQPHAGDDFNALLKSIQQPYMLFIDEFEKIYADKSDQAYMLTVLDGFIEGKRLAVVTVNDFYGVHDMMKNRPGRFYYHMRYGGLGEEFIRDYCSQNLAGDGTEDVVRYASMFHMFNFDMLKAIVEEMNRFKAPLKDVIDIINASPSYSSNRHTYKVVTASAKNYPDLEGWSSDADQPFLHDTNFSGYVKDDKGRAIQHKSFECQPGDIVKVDRGEIHFENEEITAVIRRADERLYDYSNLIL